MNLDEKVTRNVNASIDDILTSGNVKHCAEAFIKEDASDTRFVIIIGVSNNGGCFYRMNGKVTQLELDGLEMRVPEIVQGANIELFGESNG